MTGPESLHVVSVKAPDTAEAPGGRDEPYDGEDVLSVCGMSLSRETRDGRIGRSDPREVFVEQVLSILASEGPSSAMLVGKPDVGKTALLRPPDERRRRGPPPRPRPVRSLSVPDAPSHGDLEHLYATLTNLLRTAPAKDGDTFARTYNEGRQQYEPRSSESAL